MSYNISVMTSKEMLTEIINITQSIIERIEINKKDKLRYDELIINYNLISFIDMINEIKNILISYEDPVLQPFIASLYNINNFECKTNPNEIIALINKNDIYWSISLTIEIKKSCIGDKINKIEKWKFQQGSLTEEEVFGLHYLTVHFQQIYDLITERKKILASFINK